jgi:predicted nucleic acid-binding protein
VAGGNEVGSQQDLVLIDTNVFVIDLRYKRDILYKQNAAFLATIARTGTGFTTTVNLLELCGILSFNLNEEQLLALWFYFQDKYRVTVLPTTSLTSEFPPTGIGEIFNLIKKKTSLGDGLMITVAKKYLSFISTMVTWDSDHFRGKFSGTVLTPEEFRELR